MGNARRLPPHSPSCWGDKRCSKKRQTADFNLGLFMHKMHLCGPLGPRRDTTTPCGSILFYRVQCPTETWNALNCQKTLFVLTHCTRSVASTHCIRLVVEGTKDFQRNGKRRTSIWDCFVHAQNAPVWAIGAPPWHYSPFSVYFILSGSISNWNLKWLKSKFFCPPIYF